MHDDARAARPRDRFFWDSAARPGELVEIDGLVARQIARVLRMRSGDLITLVHADATERDLRLESTALPTVSGRVLCERPNDSEPRLRVTLFQALVPREKLETVIQKATEIGVARIAIVRCERSVTGRGWTPTDEQRERWRRIATEAAEQSRRGMVPDVVGTLSLQEACAAAAELDVALAATPGAGAGGFASALSRGVTSIGLFVGPEGGFSSAELNLLSERGIQAASAGPRVMRTETAGPVVVALALYAAGEMGGA